MSEREVIKSFIDFAFMIKAQLHSKEADLLRSILSIAIMESEDLVEIIDDAGKRTSSAPRLSANG